MDKLAFKMGTLTEAMVLQIFRQDSSSVERNLWRSSSSRKMSSRWPPPVAAAPGFSLDSRCLVEKLCSDPNTSVCPAKFYVLAKRHSGQDPVGAGMNPMRKGREQGRLGLAPAHVVK